MAKYGQRNRRKYKIQQKSCDSSKGTTSEIYPVAKGRLHMDFAGPKKGQYHLLVVDSFSKWLQVVKCKNLRYNGTIGYLHELFARFGILGTTVLDNGTQFMA